MLADDVGDAPAFTRFVALATYTRLDVPRERARTAFTFVADHRPGSLHAAIEPFADPDLVARWTKLMAIREVVLSEIEPLRKTKQIGSSLQAKVILWATRPELVFLENYARDLPMLFIVSEVELRPAPDDVEAEGEARPRVTIERAGGVKCERCWRYVPSVSADPSWAGLCERCQDALSKDDRAA